MGSCLVFALRLKWRHGGYLIIRKSHWGWYPHLIWSPDLIDFYEWLPFNPSQHLILPPLWYHGYVRKSTAEEQILIPHSRHFNAQLKKEYQFHEFLDHVVCPRPS